MIIEKKSAVLKYIYSLQKELVMRGHIVKIFTGVTSYKANQNKKSISKLISLFFNFKYLISFSRLIFKFKPDVIHLNHIFYEISPSILIVTKNIPVIMSVHDNMLYSPIGFIENTRKACKNKICRGCSNCMGVIKSRLEAIKRAFHRLLLYNVDLFLSNSEYTNSIVKNIFHKKAIHIKLGIELFRFFPYSFSFNLLYAGRIDYGKGLQYIIDAMPAILTKYPEAKLFIVGNGNYKKEIKEKVIKADLLRNISFINFIKREQMERQYVRSSIVIVPSIWPEPLGMVGIEAMSVGRPIIASNIGGIPEWLLNNKTGFLIEPQNSEQIADKVITLFSNQKLAHKISKCARRKAEEYSINRHVNELENVYMKLIKEYQSKINIS